MRTVRKGWLISDGRLKPRRVLVDNRGFVFGAGLGGWCRAGYGKLKLLPVEETFDYWPGEGWWEGNWRINSWSWIYGA